MPSNVTMTIYLGSGEDGKYMEEQIEQAAKRKGMKKSEFVLYCIREQLKKDIDQPK